MTHAEAKELLMKFCEYVKTRVRWTIHESVVDSFLSHLPAQDSAGEWVSIEFGLPAFHLDVLVVDEAGVNAVASLNEDGKWDFNGLDFWDSEEITHWMPLPKSPTTK